MEAVNWPKELFDAVALEEAWERVYKNGGGPGIDGITLEVFKVGVAEALHTLASDLDSDNYRPLAYRSVQIPKGDGSYRRLVIAAIRDRIVMTATANWLRPLIEPHFHPCSYAYRPGMGVHDALAKVVEYRDRGLQSVLHADVSAFFDSVDHGILLHMLGTVGVEESVQALIRSWLQCAVVENSQIIPATVGLPQGLPIAPLLANLFLTPFDRDMVERGWKLVRYVDDFVVCCENEDAAKQALADAEKALVPLKLFLKENKTRISSFSEGFKFLGAGFRGADVLPAVPHPYEEAFSPVYTAPPRASAPSGLPEIRLRTLYVQQQGALVGKHGGRITVSKDGQTLIDLPAHHIDQIFLFGRVHLSAAVMAFCLSRNIPVYLFSGRGSFYGVLMGDESASFHIKRAQYKLLDEPERRLFAAHAIVHGKVYNSMVLLRRHAHNHPAPELHEKIQNLSNWCGREIQGDMDVLRGYEGATAATYFSGFGLCMRGALKFTHRNRRPPKDPVNSLLSFGYTLLLRHIQSALAARGMDTVVGIYHESGQGHPALASDMIEELRAPVVDSLVLTLANRHQLVPDDFYPGTGDPAPCLMKDDARGRFLHAFETKLAETVAHPESKQPIDWRHVIELQVGRMRRFVLGETSTYIPFKWE